MLGGSGVEGEEERAYRRSRKHLLHSGQRVSLPSLPEWPPLPEAIVPTLSVLLPARGPWVEPTDLCEGECTGMCARVWSL